MTRDQIVGEDHGRLGARSEEQAGEQPNLGDIRLAPYALYFVGVQGKRETALGLLASTAEREARS
jgi:hypothetical protein